MIHRFCFILCALSFLSATEAFGDTPWRENHLRKQKKREQVEKALSNIPIYREKLAGVEMVGPVHGQDALTNKKDAVLHQMRLQAYRMGAEAIMEFKCKSLKGVYQSCEGFAVKGGLK